MTIDTRPLEPHRWEEWYTQLEQAFGGPRESSQERELWRDLTETERSLAVCDAGDVVGTAAAFSFRVSVPGGALLPAAGVTMVTVRSTHRRRGLLTAMMRRQLDDIRERGEPLAVLTASEPAIYGRFGYGVATRRTRMRIETTRLSLTVPDGVSEVRLRLVSPFDAVHECAGVDDLLVTRRPGRLHRPPGWERLGLLPPEPGPDTGELLCVLAERDGETVGYARYAVAARWSDGGPDGAVLLRDLEALDQVAYAALWRFLLGVDLTSWLEADNRPADDPLLHLVSDIRRCRVNVREGMFVRLVEVGAALGARRYSAPVDVVLEVEDAFCPWNAGRWRLSGDAEGASCSRTRAAPDLTLSARELATVVLGGFSLTELAGAGRVRETTPGALARASIAFRGAREPWLPHNF